MTAAALDAEERRERALSLPLGLIAAAWMVVCQPTLVRLAEPWIARRLLLAEPWIRLVLVALWAAPLGLMVLGGVLTRRGRKLRCPACGAVLRRHARFVNATGLCPQCQVRVFVPVPSSVDLTPRARRRDARLGILATALIFTGLAAAIWRHGDWLSAVAMVFVVGPGAIIALEILDRWCRRRAAAKLGVPAPDACATPNLLLTQRPRHHRWLSVSLTSDEQCLKLYSLPDDWRLAWLGPAVYRSVPVAVRAQGGSWGLVRASTLRKLQAFREREAQCDAALCDWSAMLASDSRHMSLPRTDIARWNYRAQRKRVDPTQVGVLRVEAHDGRAWEWAVVSPLAPAEVQAVLEGHAMDAARTVYDQAHAGHGASATALATSWVSR